jgi:RNA polymerase sigma factor (sigma-70 family)
VNNQTDQQLLRDYAERQSEAAFAAIVRRYVDLVYSAALRLSCDTHAAKDVTQSVFIALAQNARQLTDRPALAGWLHGTARNLAIKAIRSDVRRRAREQEAAVMNELLSTHPDASWEHIAPHLDEALGELSKPDRDAVLLRYFKNHDLRTVGAMLGISDDAAQKRVSRAVERLREFFAKRGVTVGASGLAVVITANAIQAAPAGLAAAVSSAAVLAGTVTTSTLAAQAAVTTMNWINLKSVAAIVAAAVAAGTGTYLVQQREAGRLRQENTTLVAQQTKLAEEHDAVRADAAAISNQLAALQGDEQELLRLRGEVGGLRRQTQELEKFRRQNGELKQSLAQAEPASPESEEANPERLAAMDKMSHAKQYVLGMIMYATDNEDQLPASFDALVAPYFGGDSSPYLTNLSRFEMVVRGSLTNIASPMSTIVVREREAAFLNGRWVKVYGFADGHAELKSEPPEGFEAWEKSRMVPPPSGQ